MAELMIMPKFSPLSIIRSLITIVIFVVVGPLIGAIIFAPCVMYGQSLSEPMEVALFVVGTGYLAGCVPALIAGIAVAVGRESQKALLSPLRIGLCVGLLCMGLAILILPVSVLPFAPIGFIQCFIATMICAWLSSKLLTRLQSSLSLRA